MKNLTEQDVYDITKEKLKDLSLPGLITEFTPEEADLAGAFIEDAVAETDAMEAVYG